MVARHKAPLLLPFLAAVLDEFLCNFGVNCGVEIYGGSGQLCHRKYVYIDLGFRHKVVEEKDYTILGKKGYEIRPKLLEWNIWQIHKRKAIKGAAPI